MDPIVQVAGRAESPRGLAEQSAGRTVRKAGGWICGGHHGKDVCGQGQPGPTGERRSLAFGTSGGAMRNVANKMNSFFNN